ncbi:hypothetical protein T484DRAFT_1911181 [Baffinella frigidus]|nr:hypothetical protein T484DRAFT_1911181 [Cryptophyta sp. CCMP2293]
MHGLSTEQTRSAEWDACTCKKGYYSVGFKCNMCEAGSFCFAGAKYECPPQLPASRPASESLSECMLPGVLDEPTTTPVDEEDRRVVELGCANEQ